MGLVAVFWLRIYKPLIENGLPQMPHSNSGTKPGFITDSFNALRLINPVELRVGATYSDDTATNLHRSLTEIGQLIRNMPARYQTWPANDQPIFEVIKLRATSASGAVHIDETYLWSFGELRIQFQIWHALTR